MRPLEFWALAIFSAVMSMAAFGSTAVLFQVLAYVGALCGLLASFKQFKKQHESK